MTGALWVVGLGPGDESLLAPAARRSLEEAEVVVGYRGYLALVAHLLQGKEVEAYPLGAEMERAQRALTLAASGRRVALVSSGDAGIYGMASLLLELWTEREGGPDVQVVPGVPALAAAAALLGAPLGQDFAVVSLSDILTPWEAIARRLEAAAIADFVIVLYNPRSGRRTWQLQEARRILLKHRSPVTPVGIVRRAYREGQQVRITTLSGLDASQVDMETLVIVGNSQTRAGRGRLVTPRGYRRGR
ncbi:Cobalt-factor III methyltransferase [bacterium HR25]|nr:Cobalt-factor III methyltransferase [bacterium HR25]